VKHRDLRGLQGIEVAKYKLIDWGNRISRCRKQAKGNPSASPGSQFGSCSGCYNLIECEGINKQTAVRKLTFNFNSPTGVYFIFEGLHLRNFVQGLHHLVQGKFQEVCRSSDRALGYQDQMCRKKIHPRGHREVLL